MKNLWITFVLMSIGIFVIGISIACANSPSAKDIETTEQARVNTESTGEASVKEELSKSNSNKTQETFGVATDKLMTDIARWHMKWRNSDLSHYERQDLFDELVDTADIDSIENEPLYSQVSVYFLVHALKLSISEDTAYRAAEFGVNTGFLDSMPSPCSLPNITDVPEKHRKSLENLDHECTTEGAFEDFLSIHRALADRTWLKPYLDELLGNPYSKQTQEKVSPESQRLLSNIAIWHFKWEKSGLTMNDRQDLLDELFDFPEFSSNEDKILESRISAYKFAHMISIWLFDKNARRAAEIGVNSGLNDLLPTPCYKPDDNNVPEQFRNDVTSLEIECLTTELFEDYLWLDRSLATETWLKPYVD